jgi:phosphate transport system permease protein
MPAYHGWHLGLWVTLPALGVWAIWQAVSPGLIQTAALAGPLAAKLPDFAVERQAILAEAWTLAANPSAVAFNPLAAEFAGPLRAAQGQYGLIGAALVAVFAFAGGGYGYTRIRAAFPARTLVERAIMLALLLASLLAILTTAGIVASLVFETGRFFSQVSPIDFLTGTHWSPREGAGPDISPYFGAVPLFWGTIFIGAIIAMIVAIPLGLMSAVYLTQYASLTMRKWLKPILEILAGIPTVVYGYFAALTIAPMIRDFAGGIGMTNPSTESALRLLDGRRQPGRRAAGDARRQPGDGGDPIGNHQEGSAARRASRNCRWRDAGDQPRDRRDDDRGHGGWRCRPAVGQSLCQHDHGHLPDRPAADWRPGV